MAYRKKASRGGYKKSYTPTRKYKSASRSYSRAPARSSRKQEQVLRIVIDNPPTSAVSRLPLGLAAKLAPVKKKAKA